MDNPSDYDWQQDGSLTRTNQDQNVQEFYMENVSIARYTCEDKLEQMYSSIASNLA